MSGRKISSETKIKFMLILLAFVIGNSTVERTIWQNKRTSAWFCTACDPCFDDEWYRNFRISRNTFHLVIGPVVIFLLIYITLLGADRYHLTRISMRFNFDNFLAFIVGFIQLSLPAKGTSAKSFRLTSSLFFTSVFFKYNLIIFNIHDEV